MEALHRFLRLIGGQWTKKTVLINNCGNLISFNLIGIKHYPLNTDILREA